MGRCERLKWNRRKLGMTQEELAKKVGVSQKTISNLETDETAWASMRDSTTDGIYNTLRELASWQCDIHAIFKDNAKESPREAEGTWYVSKRAWYDAWAGFYHDL